MARDRYVPALRFRSLTGLYDPVVRLTTRESEFKRRLLEQPAPRPGQRVLDLGCETGTLAIEAKRAEPRTEVVGIDGDPDVLARAYAKAEAAGIEVEFDRGLSTELPYPDSSFDVVLATLFFHHLTGADERTTAREIVRVLRPSGELHVADLVGRPIG
jgi:ubiquinone/menaquinone biosynthesis C-methylase UbiE